MFNGTSPSSYPSLISLMVSVDVKHHVYLFSPSSVLHTTARKVEYSKVVALSPFEAGLWLKKKGQGTGPLMMKSSIRCVYDKLNKLSLKSPDSSDRYLQRGYYTLRFTTWVLQREH